MRSYHCYRVNGYPRVDVLGEKGEASRRGLVIQASHKIAYIHDEFDWGFSGRGPDQLALAILLDIFGDKKIAQEHCDDFKWTFLATAPRAGVTIQETQVRQMVRKLASR